MIDPKEDGITHINVYSKGLTRLGMFLSNFTNCSIVTEDGNFSSVEGYWYWLLSPKSERRELLRQASGFAAKKLGRELANKDWPSHSDLKFQQKICTAIKNKIESNPKYLQLFKDSETPFTHYYVFDRQGIETVLEPPEGRWILDFLAKFREELKDVISEE